MNINSFAFCHRNKYELIKDLCALDEPTSEIVTKIESEFNDKNVVFLNNGSISKNGISNEAYFKTSYSDSYGDSVWLKFNKNTNTKEGVAPWYLADISIFSDLTEGILRKNMITMGNLVFNVFNDMITFLENLCQMAEPENWKYKTESKINHPILASYIKYTLKRLIVQGKLINSKDGNYIIFNTGLLDRKFGQDINIIVEKFDVLVLDTQVTMYKNPVIVLEDDRKILTMFGNVTPEIATYFDTIEEVIYNPDYDLRLNWKHVFEDRFERIKEATKIEYDLPELVMRFKGNESIIKKLAKRNYKMVVPQFYNGDVQFLLPIYLGNSYQGQPDFVLVLECDTDNKCYFGATVLTVEMSYQNARLLAKTDSPWLTNATS